MASVQAPPAVVRFGTFEVDLRAGELRRDGIKVHLQDLPFRMLELLLSRPDEIVSYEELRRSLWPNDVYVDFDRAIRSAAKRLRDALGDSADRPIFIETVERHGYRWIAPTHVIDNAAESASKTASTSSPEPVVGASNPSNQWKIIFLLLLVVSLSGAIFWATKNISSSSKPATSQSAPANASFSDAPRPSSNRQAEDFYLNGRYQWEKRTPESLSKAVDLFTQAIIHDPGYAPAYVGLADCYNLLREYTVMSPSEAYPRAFAAAKKAVELDPGSSAAHASLAFVSFNGMWNVPNAEREFRRAIELDPSNATAHHWYATYLECLRRYQEALAEIERAQALDPSSKSIVADRGSILFNAGRRQDGISLLKQMEHDEPDFISPHRYLKFIYLLTADYPHYLVEAKMEALLMHDDAAVATCNMTEKAFRTGGSEGLLRTLSVHQQELYDGGRLSPYLLAATYSAMGKKQEALHYLKIAHEQRVDGVAQLESDHAFDKLADEPEFQKLLADLGLPPLS